MNNIIKLIPEFSESLEIRLEQLDVSVAFPHLFDACSKGCAFHSGFYGSLARLKTWKSMTAMVGIKAPKSNVEIANAMNEFNWYRFNTKEWFTNEIWDFGLICHNPKTNFYSVIAASDMD